jgi:hypothetical protein
MSRRVQVGKKMLVSFILDETGSMFSVKDQTISGFNEYVETLQREDNANDIKFTLTKFNSSKPNNVEIVYDGVKVKDVEPLTDETYRPDSTTPLYDAIGQTISAVDRAKKKKEAALVVIQTDGLENASREYSQRDIFDLIDERKKDGWTFVFLGADQDAYAASAQFGISKGNTRSYSSQDTDKTFAVAAAASVAYTRRGGTQTDDFWEENQ